MLHDGAACFLDVATIVVSRDRNPLRMLLPQLLATLLRVMDARSDVASLALLGVASLLPRAEGNV
jgi:hypothetical protein